MTWIEIDPQTCTRCGICIEVCPRTVLGQGGDGIPEALVKVEPGCMDCGHCLSVCPTGALVLNGVEPAACLSAYPAERVSAAAFEHLLKTRRSTRIYTQRPLRRETIEWLLDVARWAPSATNAQPVHWTVIDGREKVHAFAGMAVEWMRQERRFPELVKAWDRGYDRIARDAPHLLLAHARDVRRGRTGDGSPVVTRTADPRADCIIAMTHVELAAWAAGLGACWDGFLMVAAEAGAPFFDTLDLPEGHRVFAILMLGEPEYRYQLVPPRRPASVAWR